jgi:hypothetical protein
VKSATTNWALREIGKDEVADVVVGGDFLEADGLVAEVEDRIPAHALRSVSIRVYPRPRLE